MERVRIDWSEELRAELARRGGGIDARKAIELEIDSSNTTLRGLLQGKGELRTWSKALLWRRVKRGRDLTTEVLLNFFKEREAELLLADYAALQKAGNLRKGKPEQFDCVAAELRQMARELGIEIGSCGEMLGLAKHQLYAMSGGKSNTSFEVKRKMWALLRYEPSPELMLWFLKPNEAREVLLSDKQAKESGDSGDGESEGVATAAQPWRRYRYTAEQIAGFLREVESGVSVTEVCKEHGLVPDQLYAWKGRFGAASVDSIERIRELEMEIGHLRTRIANLIEGQEAGDEKGKGNGKGKGG